MTTTNYAVAPASTSRSGSRQRSLPAGVADRLGYSRKHVNEIVNGRAPSLPTLPRAYSGW